MTSIRPPAVAGLFYPADATTLRNEVRHLLAVASGGHPAPKALVVPHAGYIYSGPVAASAYAWLRDAAELKRVVLLGPAHRVPFVGLAAPRVQAFATPLGEIPLDHTAMEALHGVAGITFTDVPHQGEHSLEVHLPFLQETLGAFTLIPLVVGDAQPAEVAQVLDTLWGGPETLIVISTDLSHYNDYETARHLDRDTCDAVESLAWERIDYEDACGRNPLRGLLACARQRHLKPRTVDLRSSGDTAGGRDRVVGYGAWVFH